MPAFLAYVLSYPRVCCFVFDSVFVKLICLFVYSIHILFATVGFASAFNITIEQNPPVFAPVSLTWNRNASDTNSFWFNALALGSGGVLNKVLSLQVNGTSSLNGTLNAVFILVG